MPIMAETARKGFESRGLGGWGMGEGRTHVAREAVHNCPSLCATASKAQPELHSLPCLLLILLCKLRCQLLQQQPQSVLGQLRHYNTSPNASSADAGNGSTVGELHCHVWQHHRPIQDYRGIRPGQVFVSHDDSSFSPQACISGMCENIFFGTINYGDGHPLQQLGCRTECYESVKNKVLKRAKYAHLGVSFSADSKGHQGDSDWSKLLLCISVVTK